MTQLTDRYELSNGTSIPKVGFGTYEIPAAQTKQAVLDAIEIGYRQIDTAKNYDNEKEVGQAVRASGLDRSELFVTTKLPATTKTYQGALDDFEDSMNSLDLDYVDLYLVHAPQPWDQMGSDYDEGNREVWRAMTEIYKSGRAKAIGVSNFDIADLKNIFTVSDIKPMVNQIQYYVGYRQDEITDFSEANGMLIEAFTPLARGALQGNPEVEELSKKYQVDFAQLAVKYCLQKNTVPLPRSTNPEHIKSNVQLDFEISDSDMAILDKVQDHSDIWHYEH